MKNLQNLWQRGTDFLGTPTAIMAGAMSWISDRHLVSAISNAGGFGVIACAAMSPSLLDTEIQETKKLTNKPFGVNLITLHPQLLELVDVCIDNNVTHIVLAGGLPPAEAIQKIKEANIKLMCFAPVLLLAKKLIRMGVDALIIEGHEAGGHIGPVSTNVLAQEILPHIHDVPVFIAGGIGQGQSIANYLLMGASGCQLGTRFVCATECRAHPDFKKAFVRASARDAVASVQLDPRFPVIPVRALQNEASQRFIEFQQEAIHRVNTGQTDLKSAQMDIENFWGGALRKAVVEGDIHHGSLMAGQSVGMVTKEQPVAEILEELCVQAEEFLKRI